MSKIRIREKGVGQLMTADPSEGDSKSGGKSANVRVFGDEAFLVDTKVLEAWTFGKSIILGEAL